MADERLGHPEQPLLRVVRGEPGDDEVAALLAVLSARDASPGSTPDATRSGWADPARAVRRQLTAGPGGWRRSALPV